MTRNGVATLENSGTVSQKVKHSYHMPPAIPLLRRYPVLIVASTGNNSNMNQLMTGLTKCGTSIQ